MIEVKERVVDLDNFRAEAVRIGALYGYYVQAEDQMIIQRATIRQEGIDNYITAVENNTRKDLTISNLLDVESIIENNSYDADIPLLLSTIDDFRKDTKLIGSVGIQLEGENIIGTTHAAIILCNHLFQEVSIDIIDQFKKAVETEDIDHPIIDVITNALRDLINHQYDISTFLTSIGVQHKEEDLEILSKQYEDQYNSTVDAKIDAALTLYISNLRGGFWVDIYGYEGFIAASAQLFEGNDELVTFIKGLKPSEIMDTATIDVIHELGNLSAPENMAAANAFGQLFQGLLLNNKLGDYTNIAYQQDNPFYNVLSITDVVYHAYVLAGSELYNESIPTDDLSETTKTLVDLIDVRFTDLIGGTSNTDNVSFYDTTPYQILSTCVVAVPILSARTPVLRLSTEAYQIAQTMIGGKLLSKYYPEYYKRKMEEAEKYAAGGQ